MDADKKKVLWMEIKERGRVGIESRSKLKMCHYAGTKAFARVRDENEAKGNKMDKLQTWLKTHTPKEGSRLDDASTMEKHLIDVELAHLDGGQDNDATRDEIFEKVGLGIILPRSCTKRCASEEETAKRLNVEEEHQATKDRLNRVEKMFLNFIRRQGLSEDILLTDDLTNIESTSDQEDVEELEGDEDAQGGGDAQGDEDVGCDEEMDADLGI